MQQPVGWIQACSSWWADTDIYQCCADLLLTVLSKKYYNGMTHDEIVNGSGKPRNGIDAWCDAGGIAGRGVLLDWLSWRRQTQPDTADLSPVESSKISLTDLKEVAAYQGVTFEAGDILLIRSGFVEWHNNANESDRRKNTAEKAEYIGVEATQEAVEWFWDNHFAAVAGDTVAFESWPPVTSTSGGVCCKLRRLRKLLHLTNPLSTRMVFGDVGYAYRRDVGLGDALSGVQEGEEVDFLPHECPAASARRYWIHA